MLANFIALFAVIWLWFVNGRPRTVEHWVGYLIITGFCFALSVGGALVWAIGNAS